MLNYKDKKLLIWDWNGTLLDDVDYCVDNINVLLKKRNLPLIDKKRYREVFTFPVINYYKAVGFDLEKEGFEKPAHEYIELYFGNFYKTKLFPCAAEVLEKLSNAGYKQVVLSAMEHQSLKKTLDEKGILKYFDNIAGISDHYGGSKTDSGKHLIKELNFNPEEVVMIGDTLHDKEVADIIGVDAILVSQGHYSTERLFTAGVPVFKNLIEVANLFV